MFYNMDVNLTGHDFDIEDAEAALLSQGIAIHRMEPGEQVILAKFTTSEGWMENWVLEASYAMRSNPSGLFVAEKNGKVIGFAACEALGPEYFGPMETTASMRGLGV